MATRARKTTDPSENEDDTSHRRLIEAGLDPRARALLLALREWLPPAIAWDRSMNAAAPIFMLETASPGTVPDDLLEARASIVSALSNASAMRGHVATEERIEAAIRAWHEADESRGVDGGRRR